MSPEERRKAHILGFTDADAGVMEMFGWHNLKDAHAYDRLLAYFDEHEPAVADAIRFGLARTEVWHGSSPSTKTVAIGPTTYQLYRIANPDPEDPSFDVPVVEP